MEKAVKKRIILVVTNDLEGDQRLHKMASSLQKQGWEPILIGRILPDSKPLYRTYKVLRKKFLFSKGPIFYACFNIRIFIHLFFARADLFVANDLDTLSGVWCASRMRRIPMVYDSHEYFTEVPELVDRKMVKRIWKYIEKTIQPRLQNVITVNESIAEIFRVEYGQEVTVIKNLPIMSHPEIKPGHLPKYFKGKPIIIYQGAVNVGRGIEEMVRAMGILVEFNLLIVGGGDKLSEIEGLVKSEGLDDRVYFTGRVPFDSIAWYTSQAKIGISLEQDIGLNYRLALPNKLFDYMQAGIPVLASNLPEIRRVVEETGFGIVISDFSPASIAEEIRKIILVEDLYQSLKSRAIQSISLYSWEGQEDVLFQHYRNALGMDSD